MKKQNEIQNVTHCMASLTVLESSSTLFWLELYNPLYNFAEGWLEILPFHKKLRITYSNIYVSKYN